MNILLIGSGVVRETFPCALEEIKQSPLCERLFIAPGNPGMAGLGEILSVKSNDILRHW